MGIDTVQEFFRIIDSFNFPPWHETGTDLSCVENLPSGTSWTVCHDGHVVALINQGTKSSSEGIASSLSRSPRGSTVGFLGTNGSFGVAGGEIIIPGGYIIRYPFGRSLDRNGQVQIDSRPGEGGVTPDLRVPRNVENILAFTEGIDIELKYAADHLNRVTAGVNINDEPQMVQ